MHKRAQFFLILVSFSLLAVPDSGFTQMITGSWKGKIDRQKVEVKIIQNGDSLTGTSYYFESPGNYRRYSIKGYFDQETNSAVWWDDRLLEEKSGRFTISIPGKVPMLSRADFNCPGGGKMMLDGKSSKKETDTEISGDVHLDKISKPEFEDEWDFVIDNWLVGANDPYIIDSINTLSYIPAENPIVEEQRPTTTAVVIIETEKPEKREPTLVKPVVIEPEPSIPTVIKAPTIEEKFITRKKTLIKEIPITGDSIELRFYDNAEIDGDSISLFLNDKLLFQHIRLTGNAYSIKLAVSSLNESNELIMVAENLGSIPPNTSYMVAILGEKRYDAYLSSTEGSSAMIRFVKDKRE